MPWWSIITSSLLGSVWFRLACRSTAAVGGSVEEDEKKKQDGRRPVSGGVEWMFVIGSFSPLLHSYVDSVGSRAKDFGFKTPNSSIKRTLSSS